MKQTTRRKLHEIDKESFVLLWNDLDVTQAEIAATFGISTTFATSLARRWGLTVPRPACAKKQEYMPTPEEIAATCKELREAHFAECRKKKASDTRLVNGRRPRVCYSYSPRTGVFTGFGSVSDAT